MGIEPTLSAWEAEVLPLNYTRDAGHLSPLPKLIKGRMRTRLTASAAVAS